MSIWDPYELAMVECDDGIWREANYITSTKGDLYWVPYWRFKDGLTRPAGISKARPVVVIDPEDREEVLRLCNTAALIHHGRVGLRSGSVSPSVEDYQAALRRQVEADAPLPEVYEHLVVDERPYGLLGTLTSACGKEWSQSSPDEVTVIGRCPDCTAAASRWSA